MSVSDMTAPARFWAKVDKGALGGCWDWLGGRTKDNYGQMSMGRGRCVFTHRFAFEMLVGPIPDGHQLDHLCRRPICCNPSHLEPVTPQENTLRGMGPSALNAQKTHCLHGHPLSGENLRVRPGGSRECRTCRREIGRRHAARRAAKAAAA